jgi:hypothetical protein
VCHDLIQMETEGHSSQSALVVCLQLGVLNRFWEVVSAAVHLCQSAEHEEYARVPWQISMESKLD